MDTILLIASALLGYVWNWEWSSIVFFDLLLATILWSFPSLVVLWLESLLLAAAGMLVAFGQEDLAEEAGVWAFYAMVIMLVAIILENASLAPSEDPSSGK